MTHAGTVDCERPPGAEPPAAGGLSLEYFIGTVRRAVDGDVLNAVDTLIRQGNVDPATILEVSWTLMFVISDERAAVSVWEVRGGVVCERAAPELSRVLRE